MKLFTSRYGNKTLASGNYTTVRISLGTPKWNTGYELTGEIKSLMPFGLLGHYDEYEDFKPAYFRRLDEIGIDKIRRQLNHFASYGKDVVLLCFEDIRKPGDWCHRTAFAEWFFEKTGYKIEELPEPEEAQKKEPAAVQGTIFDLL